MGTDRHVPPTYVLVTICMRHRRWGRLKGEQNRFQPKLQESAARHEWMQWQPATASVNRNMLFLVALTVVMFEARCEQCKRWRVDT
jgi:hypothetical protein